jgi:hypothetical protein
MGSLTFKYKKICHICGSGKTDHNRKGSENWYHNYGKDKPMCARCYSRLIEHPRYLAKHKHTQIFKDRQKRYDQRKRRFLGHGQRVLTFRQLTGYCSQCHNNIYDGTCKMTNMHHWVYIIILPWFGTEEVCIGCHNKTKERDAYGHILKESV